MECYARSRIGDLVVLDDQEQSDRLPSPGSWSDWGMISVPKSFGFCNKSSVMVNDEQQHLDNEVEMEGSITLGRNQQQEAACGDKSLRRHRPYYDDSTLIENKQFDDLTDIQQLDQLFLNSLLEDLPWTEILQQSEWDADDVVFSDGMLLDCGSSSSSDAPTMQMSKCSRLNEISPKGQDTASLSCELDHHRFPPAEVSPFNVWEPMESKSVDQHVDEETTLAESVLHELEMATTQLTDKTRLCFRDALYRLAKNSRQNMIVKSEIEDLSAESTSWTGQHDEIRFRKDKSMESETNSIDRAIANLMFNKMELNAQNFLVSNSTEEITRDYGVLPSCSLNQSQISSPLMILD